MIKKNNQLIIIWKSLLTFEQIIFDISSLLNL